MLMRVNAYLVQMRFIVRMMIGRGGLKADPAKFYKIQIVDWPIPHNQNNCVSDLKSPINYKNIENITPI